MISSHLDFRGMIDASPNPYLVLDRELNIAFANRAYLQSVKRDLADLVGRWAWEAFPTDPETERQAIASFERVKATGQPDTMALLRFDVPRPEAEGGGFEERWWSITHSPVLDAAGQVALIIQHPINVTDLERLRDVVTAKGDAEAIDLLPAHTGIFTRAQSRYMALTAARGFHQARSIRRNEASQADAQPSMKKSRVSGRTPSYFMAAPAASLFMTASKTAISATSMDSATRFGAP
jgi:hypothetical protein